MTEERWAEGKEGVGGHTWAYSMFHVMQLTQTCGTEGFSAMLHTKPPPSGVCGRHIVPPTCALSHPPVHCHTHPCIVPPTCVLPKGCMLTEACMLIEGCSFIEACGSGAERCGGRSMLPSPWKVDSSSLAGGTRSPETRLSLKGDTRPRSTAVPKLHPDGDQLEAP